MPHHLGRRLLLLGLVVGLWLTLGDAAAWACPTCKDAVAGDPAQANMVRGYFWSILFMMSMPFLILGGLSTYFYLEVRKARAAQQAAAAQQATPADARHAPPAAAGSAREREPVAT